MRPVSHLAESLMGLQERFLVLVGFLQRRRALETSRESKVLKEYAPRCVSVGYGHQLKVTGSSLAQQKLRLQLCCSCYRIFPSTFQGDGDRGAGIPTVPN